MGHVVEEVYREIDDMLTEVKIIPIIKGIEDDDKQEVITIDDKPEVITIDDDEDDCSEDNRET